MIGLFAVPALFLAICRQRCDHFVVYEVYDFKGFIHLLSLGPFHSILVRSTKEGFQIVLFTRNLTVIANHVCTSCYMKELYEGTAKQRKLSKGCSTRCDVMYRVYGRCRRGFYPLGVGVRW